MKTTARQDATSFPLDFTLSKDNSSQSASVVLRAKVETKLRNDARQERTLIALDPCRAFHALQDRLRVLKEV